MDLVPAELFPQSDQDKYLGVAHSERWNCLKTVIVRLYLGNYGQEGKTATLDQVAEFMRVNYSFHAAPTEYRSHFRTWKVSKRVVKDIKDNVASTLAKRKWPGTSTSHITVGEGDSKRQLRPDKLMRHLKKPRQYHPIQAITPGLLSSWNLPYDAFIASLHKEMDKPSPFGVQGTTPDHIDIDPLTPGREAAGLSPNMELVYQKAKEHRAVLFLEGRLEELVVAMCGEDRKLLVNYLHDFYIHGFTMAKEWSKRLQTQSGFAAFPVMQQLNTAGSPSMSSSWMGSAVDSTLRESPSQRNAPNPPTQLCNWSIHVPPLGGDATSTSLLDPPQADLLTTSFSFTDELRRSIAGNSFTGTHVENLPIAQHDVVRAIENDPEALKVDAWKLAIMAGNYELIFDLYEQNRDELPDGIDKIHPLHLAAAFLDGGHACCKVFECLVQLLGVSHAFHHNVDDNGHTILDALIVSILRSHTSTSPDLVSSAFRSPNRFPGEETDICGRWTADTPILRELFDEGFCRIPTAWKHPFCHTAVQAVCHCIIAIYAISPAPRINTMSGLFTRLCTECGLKLILGPLHTLVVTTFHLASLGRPGETLFGVLAVLVCLLNLGADASLRVDVSVDEILGNSVRGCSHTSLSPLELMQRVPENVINDWGDDIKVGWHCFSQILSRAEKQRESRSESDPSGNAMDRSGDILEDDLELYVDGSSSEIECELYEVHESNPPWTNIKCCGTEIGLLWATIQTEFLTYRRIKETDPWVSERFSMEALEKWSLERSETFQTPLITDRMMRHHSRCGWFLVAHSFIFPTAQETCTWHFMNMDIDERTTYSEVPYYF
ncbi:hypothetical protein ANO14919_085230 [Xylariales sp. No.14919]|nr:hypothetical protein ANO14919_085230 [Xylariales sp. No.14919]